VEGTVQISPLLTKAISEASGDRAGSMRLGMPSAEANGARRRVRVMTNVARCLIMGGPDWWNRGNGFWIDVIPEGGMLPETGGEEMKKRNDVCLVMNGTNPRSQCIGESFRRKVQYDNA
jgi:hypothetical protein